MDSINIRETKSSSINIKNLDKPTLIAGFPGAGLVGSISTSYIIDTLKMHQIASIESQYINPGVIYVGGKLRHPFRLYSNEKGNVCVVVCESPIMINGIHSVMNEFINWSLTNEIREAIVLDGIAHKSIPKKGRKAIILHDDGDFRKQNIKYLKKEKDMGRKKYTNGNSNLDKTAIEISKNYNYTAYIGGIVGGLLSSCLSYGIPSTAILVPSQPGLPDPEGAALLIDSFNMITTNKNLKIDTTQLKTEGRKIREQLGKIMDSVKQDRQQEGRDDKLMYG